MLGKYMTWKMTDQIAGLENANDLVCIFLPRDVVVANSAARFEQDTISENKRRKTDRPLIIDPR